MLKDAIKTGLVCSLACAAVCYHIAPSTATVALSPDPIKLVWAVMGVVCGLVIGVMLSTLAFLIDKPK